MRIRSGIGRRIDPSYPSNRFALGATLVAGAVAGIWGLSIGDEPAEAARAAVGAGGATLLAWAIARELDPDRPFTAGLAAVVAPWSLVGGDPSLVGAGVTLLAVRVAAGTTGRRLYGADAAALVGLAGWSAASAAGPGPGVIGAAAVLYGDRRLGRVAALAMAGAAIVVWALWGGGPQPTRFTFGAWALVASGALSIPGLFWVRATVATDRGDRRVSATRVRVARITAVGAAAAAGSWFGGDGVIAMSPVLVALGATAVGKSN